MDRSHATFELENQADLNTGPATLVWDEKTSKDQPFFEGLIKFASRLALDYNKMADLIKKHQSVS